MIAKTVRMGVEVRLNTEVTPELVTALAPDVCIAAVGSTPMIPPIKGVEMACPIMDLYDGKAVAGDQVALAMQGKHVTLVEMGPEIARDANSLHKPALVAELAHYAAQVTVMKNTVCTEVTNEGILCTNRDGVAISVPADTVILAAGMVALRGVADELCAASDEGKIIGDCKRPRQIAEAVREAYDAAMDI